MSIRPELEQLIEAFNRGSLDVPAGLLTAHTSFALNGTPYETLLGGSPDDPLIRLLARGAAGYRTAARALQYALQRPAATIQGALEGEGGALREVRLLVEGRLRGTGEPLAVPVTLSMTTAEGRLVHLDAACAPADLQQITAARAR